MICSFLCLALGKACQIPGWKGGTKQLEAIGLFMYFQHVARCFSGSNLVLRGEQNSLSTRNENSFIALWFRGLRKLKWTARACGRGMVWCFLLAAAALLPLRNNNKMFGTTVLNDLSKDLLVSVKPSVIILYMWKNSPIHSAIFSFKAYFEQNTAVFTCEVICEQICFPDPVVHNLSPSVLCEHNFFSSPFSSIHGFHKDWHGRSH